MKLKTKLFLTILMFVVIVKNVLSAQSTPNIVVILADDLGYGSVNCYGAPKSLIRTPHVDQLAREGMRFTDANTPGSVCSPTRYALLTGRYAWRGSLKYGVLQPPEGGLLIEEGFINTAFLFAGKRVQDRPYWEMAFGVYQSGKCRRFVCSATCSGSTFGRVRLPLWSTQQYRLAPEGLYRK